MPDIQIISYNLPARNQTGRSDNLFMGEKGSFTSVSADTLNERFRGLVEALGQSLKLPQTVGPFKVDALDIELEITAEGQVGLFGNGGKLGGKGSLTLRLKC